MDTYESTSPIESAVNVVVAPAVFTNEAVISSFVPSALTP